MIVNNTFSLAQQAEIARFMRPQSFLVSFAKSLRCEAVQPNDSSEKQDEDPFKDIDLDELPDELKANIQKAQAAYASTKVEAARISSAHDAAVAYGRDQQSRADRAAATLKAHNLSGSNATVQSSPHDKLVDKFTAQLIDMGIDPKTARSQAFIQANTAIEAANIIHGEVQGQLQSSSAVVYQIEADRAFDHLCSPTQDLEGIMQDDGIRTSVRNHMAVLIQNGTKITLPILENLKNMAFGEKLRLNPLAGGGGFALPPKQQSMQKQGAPKTANGDTQRAVEATKAIFKSQVPKTKKL